MTSQEQSTPDQERKAPPRLRGEAGPVRRILGAPLLAASFLTILPVPVPGLLAAGSMGLATACFPLVGAFVGLILAGLDRMVGPLLPPMVTSALLVGALLGITGAFHLDALMDSSDGLFGGRDPERRLAIMKDSRVGSYGVAAAVSVLLLEFACLASMPIGYRGGTLVLAGLWSRWSMIAVLWGFPAARGSGLAAGLKPQVGWPHMAAATVLAFGLAVVAAGWTGLALGVGSGLLVVAGGRFAVAKVGGVTGDLCGGLGQMLEVAILLAAVTMPPLT